MTYQPAKLDKIAGFSIAYIDRSLNGGQDAIVGTFKGKRAFFQTHEFTSRKMVYKGMVEDKGTLYYAIVPVIVDMRVRVARFTSYRAPTTWERLSYD
jgi:hypothetical protein